MATPTLPKNADRVFRKMLAVLNAGAEADSKAGANTIGRIKRQVWVCAGAPASTAPAGMDAKALILDTTNDNIYRYISGTTYVQVDAES